MEADTKLTGRLARAAVLALTFVNDRVASPGASARNVMRSTVPDPLTPTVFE